MAPTADPRPFGTDEIPGTRHRPSPFPVDETLHRLTNAIAAAGALVFAVVDHSGEAERAGVSLRNTKLVIFGNPRAGTPVMVAHPLAALDLPLKVLVWADDHGEVWMSYLSAEWLAERHHLQAELAKILAAPDVLTSRIADST